MNAHAGHRTVSGHAVGTTIGRWRQGDSGPHLTRTPGLPHEGASLLPDSHCS